MILSWLVLLSLVLVPLICIAFDSAAGVVARNRKYQFSDAECDDFAVLVPIWGSMNYLENVEYLSQYGDKVVLCTTSGETDEFYDAFHMTARMHGFRTFIDMSSKGEADSVVRRATSGTTRDRLIRNALATVTATYVVPLDADSTTEYPLNQLVGEFRHRGFEVASVRLVTQRPNSLLTRLQRFEYRMAMQLRFIAPWMISGACHVGKTAVLRDIMQRHSLFFQGNDVEIGVIAKAQGYSVGHIPFEVTTIVPHTFRGWVRQRLAWTGGEFRLFIVNFRFIVNHPLFWLYGAIIAILMFPLRWWSVTHPGWPLLIVLGLYVLVVLYLHLKSRNGWILLMPLYTLVSSMIFTPIGIVSYVHMSLKHKNWGVIRPKRPKRLQAVSERG